MTKPVAPMLAKVLPDENTTLVTKKRKVLPCYVQPKYDGYRCMVGAGPSGNLYVFSRNMKPFVLPPHLSATLKTLPLFFGNIVLDGELYIHGSGFEAIQSAVTNKSGSECSERLREELSYVVYDIQDSELSFESRLKIMEELGMKYRIPFLINFNAQSVRPDSGVFISNSYFCRTMQAVDEFHAGFVAMGFEGTMLRDPRSRYVSIRSPGLMKKKDFKEMDCRLVAITEGSGKNKGTAVLLLETPEHKVRFTATAPGTYTEKEMWWIYREDRLKSKPIVSVKYQGLMNTGAPRFPIALGVKNDR